MIVFVREQYLTIKLIANSATQGKWITNKNFVNNFIYISYKTIKQIADQYFIKKCLITSIKNLHRYITDFAPYE